MQYYYETLILAVPEVTKDEVALLEKQFEQKVKSAKGAIVSFERWGKYKLAYSIRKNDYGVYFLARFQIEDQAAAGDLIKDIHDLFIIKLNGIVMRDMTTALQGSDLSYVKPESLEETPARDIDSFLRENKMEGLLSSLPSEKAGAHRQAAGDVEEVELDQADEVQ